MPAARAEAPASDVARAPLRLGLDACAAPLHDELRSILQVELQGPILETAPPPTPGLPEAAPSPYAAAADVHIGCRDAVFVIDLVDPSVNQSARREMDLSLVPPTGRARTLALGIVELIAAVRATSRPAITEPPTQDEHGAAPIEITPPALLQPPQRPREHFQPPLLEVGLAGTMTQIGSPMLMLFGGALGVQYRAKRWALLGLQLRYERTSTPIVHGDVQAESLSGTFSYGIRIYETESHWLDFSAGGRLGTARLTATSENPARYTPGEVRGLFGGPLLSTRFEVRPALRFAAGIGAEGGIVTLPVIGKVLDAQRVSFDGAWWGVAVNLGTIF